jgi:hypothetical protein
MCEHSAVSQFTANVTARPALIYFALIEALSKYDAKKFSVFYEFRASFLCTCFKH